MMHQENQIDKVSITPTDKDETSNRLSFVVSNVTTDAYEQFKALTENINNTTSLSTTLPNNITAENESSASKFHCSNEAEDVKKFFEILANEVNPSKGIPKNDETTIIEDEETDQMTDSYSKETVDAKFEILEQKMITLETKIDGKLDHILSKIDIGFSHLNTRVNDLWKVVTAAGIAIGVGIILILVQNSLQKPNQTTIVIPSNHAEVASPTVHK